MDYYNIRLRDTWYIGPSIRHDSVYAIDGIYRAGKHNLYLFSTIKKFKTFLKNFLFEKVGISLADVDITAVEKWISGEMPDTATIGNLFGFQNLMSGHWIAQDIPMPEKIWESFSKSGVSEFFEDVFQKPHLHYVDKLMEIQRAEGIDSRDAQGWHDLLIQLSAAKFADPTFMSLWEKVLRDIEAPAFKSYFGLLLEYFKQAVVIDP